MSRVTDIRYVGYGVVDFDTERRFYGTACGLTEVAARDGMAWFKTPGGDEHHTVRLRTSTANHLDIIGLATHSRADVEALHAKVAAVGCRIVHDPRDLDGPGAGYAFRFFSPDGLPFEISSGVARSDSRSIGTWEGLDVRINHVVLHSPWPSGGHALLHRLSSASGSAIGLETSCAFCGATRPIIASPSCLDRPALRRHRLRRDRRGRHDGQWLPV